MGTIAPNESLEIQREVEQQGGAYCEAPVLGSLAEAKAGTLFVMVGGTEAQFTTWSSLFRSLGREPRRIGPVGSAAALKLALNHLIAAETSAFALSLGLVQRSGVAVETYMAILRESALYAPTFDKKLPRLLKRDYHHPNFSTRHHTRLGRPALFGSFRARQSSDPWFHAFLNDFLPTALFLFTYSLRIDAGPVYSVLFKGGARNGAGHVLKSGFRAPGASTAAHHIRSSFLEPLADAEGSKQNDRPARLRSSDR